MPLPTANLPRLARTKGPESRAARIVSIERLAGRYRHSKVLGWLRWDGMRWEASEDAEVAALQDVRVYAEDVQDAYDTEAVLQEATARQLVRAYLVDALGTEDKAEAAMLGIKVGDLPTLVPEHKDEHKPVAKAVNAHLDAKDQAAIWLNLLSLTSLRNLLTLSAGDPEVRVRSDELDRHPDLLNTRSGVLDLRTLELTDHDPALLLTKVTGAAYVPSATSADWATALEAIPEDVRGWLQVRFGQSATGRVPDDDRMLVNAGGGANGKTTVISTVMRALGDYAGLVPHKALLDDGGHSTELMTLRGLRMAVMEETPEEGHLNMHRVKATIGSDKIKARLIRRDNVEFETTHSMWINTNHMPQVAATDDGTWRRLCAVPWPFRYTTTPQRPGDRLGDPQLRARLQEGATGELGAAVLAWVVQGAHEWYRAGRRMPADPERVTEASSNWRQSSDVALLFVQDNIVANPHGFITAAELNDALGEFLKDQGKPPWTAQTKVPRLHDAMRNAGITVAKGPEKASKVKATDVQSTRMVFGYVPKGPGSVVKGWFGVSWRTADEAGSYLAAVR